MLCIIFQSRLFLCIARHFTEHVLWDFEYDKMGNSEHKISVWAARYFVWLEWRHTGRDGVSNLQPHQCLLNRLFGRRSKKTSKLRVTNLCAGNFYGARWIPHTNGQQRGKGFHLMTSLYANCMHFRFHHPWQVILFSFGVFVRLFVTMFVPTISLRRTSSEQTTLSRFYM